RSNEILWWWADALFMAPPALTELSSIMKTNKFSVYTFQEWKNTYKLLYNKEDSLFYRDKKKYNHIDKLGRNIYWLRGNGWVVAGLAKMLNILNPDNKQYQKYQTVYFEMIDKLVALQSDDGLWRSALLRPKEYPVPETSGSALVCYALAWGVNAKILKGLDYEEAMLDCWKGLKSKVTEEGKLTNVQPVGHEPARFSPNNSEVFGSGAFLLVASEIFEYKSH
ncbi:MAG TPA: glycoside hydrolase family 88 protein, partial [Balneolaceae bacterium]